MGRLAVVAQALRHARALAERERWPIERREARKRERLTDLVCHAARHSAYYREALAGYDPAVGADSLPELTRATMMERFDEVVCDQRLRRDALLRHAEQLRDDDLYLGSYRAMTTSGSSGRKGLFVYDAAGWATIAGQFLYFSAMAGTRPRVPRLKLAAIGGSSPAHMSRRGARTLDVGLHRILSLSVTRPVGELVAALNAFDPDVLNVYPSMGVLLAEEQLAGRLRLSLRTMSTSSELRTPEAAARIEEAFGVRPFDLYATTEGLWGGECERHAGPHLFEEDVIVENVDEDGRAVPDGTPGARLLVTNLANRVQPLIRLEVSRRGDAERDDVRLRTHAAAPRARRGTRRGRHLAAGRRRATRRRRAHAVLRRRARPGRRRVPGRAGGRAPGGPRGRARRGAGARGARPRRRGRTPAGARPAEHRDRGAPPRCPRALGRRQARAGGRRSSRADDRLAPPRAEHPEACAGPV
jgi:phenylacetate-CoA ligase